MDDPLKPRKSTRSRQQTLLRWMAVMVTRCSRERQSSSRLTERLLTPMFSPGTSDVPGEYGHESKVGSNAWILRKSRVTIVATDSSWGFGVGDGRRGFIERKVGGETT